jgi:hypothetical protein
MRKFIFLVLFLGCSAPKTPEQPLPNVLEVKRPIKFIDFKDKNEYQTNGSIGNDTVTLYCTSIVVKDNGGFVYKWKIRAEGKAKCLARWEIFDHIMGKMPYMFEISPNNEYEFTHKTKETPCYVWRTATCFEKNNKPGDWLEFTNRHNVIISKDDFWFSTQAPIPCVAPQNSLIERDFKQN